MYNYNYLISIFMNKVPDSFALDLSTKLRPQYEAINNPMGISWGVPTRMEGMLNEGTPIIRDHGENVA